MGGGPGQHAGGGQGSMLGGGLGGRSRGGSMVSIMSVWGEAWVEGQGSIVSITSPWCRSHQHDQLPLTVRLCAPSPGLLLMCSTT